MSLDCIVKEVNAMVRRWLGYLHYRNCSQTLGSLRYHVEQLMITCVSKRHKVRDRMTGLRDLNLARFAKSKDCTMCQQRRLGGRSTPCSEGYRKAMCEKTACMV